MKRNIIIIAAAMASLMAGAQAKVDVGSRARLRAMQAPLSFSTAPSGRPMLKAKSIETPMVDAFITLSEGASMDQLTAMELELRPTRGGLVLARIPLDKVQAVEALDCVKSIKTAQPVRGKMDLVRAETGVDRIHAGDNLPTAFTGKGVITGIVDGGFDPNHINFFDSDGNRRIKQFTFFNASQSGGSLVEQRFTGEQIAKIDTENEETFHGTHTAGIMAGSYRGKVKGAVKKNSWQTTVEEMDNPYYGIACESDIVTAAAYDGQLSDIYIAYGVESMLDYAYEHSQPLAINLSLGSNVGPHDGTSTICRYLDAVMDSPDVNTIVCISAGNEGDVPIALSRTLENDGDQVATCLYAMYDGYITGYQNPRSGQVYIYSDSAEPFDVQAVIINKTRNAVAMRMPLAAAPDGAYQYWTSSSDFAQDAADIVSEQFSRYLTGYVGLNAETDTESGRYCALIDMLTWDNVAGSNAQGNYILGFIVTGHEGQRIDIYGDGSMCNFSSFELEGYLDGEFDGTINDIATGKNTIIVGSYNTRDDWASVDGGVYGYAGAFPMGKMSPFTSYGTLIDGRTLPHICAPGATVISSTNQYYVTAAKLADSDLQACVSDDTRSYSWHQCVGTSMAAPVVTGTIALWLEAYPELTYAEAQQILRETAVTDDDVAASGTPAQWGAGKLDAYAGLLKVLELKASGISSTTADTADAIKVVRNGQSTFDVLNTAAGPTAATIYNLAGAAVLTARSAEPHLSIDCSSLPAGVYILNINTTHSEKIIIRP